MKKLFINWHIRVIHGVSHTRLKTRSRFNDPFKPPHPQFGRVMFMHLRVRYSRYMHAYMQIRQDFHVSTWEREDVRCRKHTIAPWLHTICAITLCTCMHAYTGASTVHRSNPLASTRFIRYHRHDYMQITDITKFDQNSWSIDQKIQRPWLRKSTLVVRHINFRTIRVKRDTIRAMIS